MRLGELVRSPRGTRFLENCREGAEATEEGRFLEDERAELTVV